MSTSASQIVSHYRLIELIGRGAMGEVWLAEDTQLPRQVAVKLLPRHLSQDREAVERLLREAQAAASVDHPGVVTVYEAGLADDRPYLVMQRVEGDTLEKRLARGPLPVAEALAIASRIADALAEVHALGIVHRDLKPSNIVLTSRGPKLLDFGVASVKGSPRLTATGVAVGTPLAMSPEQVKGLPPDNRSDLWSLGVTLYQSLTGRMPFAGASLEAVTYQLLNAQPPAPGTLRSDVQPDLDYIVMKLLRKDPAHRYARAEDLLADLASCGASAAAGAAPATGAAAGEPAGPPRLAVLEFEVMSSDADDAFLADGLADDLVVDLTRLGGLHVASRGETSAYKDRSVPPRTIARELGVDFVLLGSVRRAGNRARINVQLVRATDGYALWAERFDRTLDDLFEVQAEVSKRVVAALQVALRPGEQEMLDRAPTKSPEAYTFYLRAREHIALRRRAGLLAAEELLVRAIELDPKFALAHAALAQTHALRAMGWFAGREMADRAQPHAQRALELEPDLLEGHLAMAMVHRIRDEHEPLLREIERVVTMNPDHEEAQEWAAWSYMASGQPERAVAMLERLVARRSEALAPAMWLGSCYEMLGREAAAARANDLLGDRLIERVRKHPEDIYARSLLASQLVRTGQIEAGIAQVEKTVAAAPDEGRIRYNAACTLARAGMPDRAIEQLKAGIRNIPEYLTDWPRRDPDLVSLHDHPEFIRMFGKAER